MQAALRRSGSYQSTDGYCRFISVDSAESIEHITRVLSTRLFGVERGVLVMPPASPFW